MEAQALMPAVSLKLAEAYTRALHQRLLAGELDLAVMHLRERLPSLDMRPLMTEPIVFAGAAGLFRPGEAVTMRQVLQHQSLVTAPSGRLRLLYERAVATAGAAPTRFMEVDSLPALLELLAAGVGVAMLAYSTIHAGVQAGRLSWAHLAPRPLTRKIVIARPQDRLETPAWLAMADLIRRIVNARAADYHWTVAPPA
jgi:LysR family nitrogen assimilation transcriptional regulator